MNNFAVFTTIENKPGILNLTSRKRNAADLKRSVQCVQAYNVTDNLSLTMAGTHVRTVRMISAHCTFSKLLCNHLQSSETPGTFPIADIDVVGRRNVISSGVLTKEVAENLHGQGVVSVVLSPQLVGGVQVPGAGGGVRPRGQFPCPVRPSGVLAVGRGRRRRPGGACRPVGGAAPDHPGQHYALYWRQPGRGNLHFRRCRAASDSKARFLSTRSTRGTGVRSLLKKAKLSRAKLRKTFSRPGTRQHGLARLLRRYH